MNKQERISNLLHNIDIAKIRLNKAGHAVIKSKHPFNITKAFNTSINIIPKDILVKLLHPEDRIPRKNIALWVKELNNIFENVHDGLTISDNLSTIYNQTSLLLCLTGEIERARDLCNKQIALAITCAKDDPEKIKYILQPLINLGRLERLQCNHLEALKIFDLLKSITNSRPIEFKNFSICPKGLINIINNSEIFSNLITMCKILEPIKTYLAMGDFRLIIELCDKLAGGNEHEKLKTIAYEALIISHICLGQYQKSYDLTIEALSIFPASIEHIFLIRQMELLHFCKDSKVKSLISKLINFIIYEHKYSLDVNFAYFVSEFGLKLVKMGFIEEAIEVTTIAINAAEDIQDEPLTILCLDTLHRLKPNTETNLRLLKLISNTNYKFITNRFDNSQPKKHGKNESKRILLNLAKKLSLITA